MNATGMRFSPDSVSGSRLRQYGVSSRALEKTRIYAVRWQPVPAFTLPVPFFGCITLIRRTLVDRELDGELADSPALAPLVHQLCHTHQRLEWGVFLYLWRHLWARIVPRGVPIRYRQVERECYESARLVQEYYQTHEVRWTPKFGQVVKRGSCS